MFFPTLLNDKNDFFFQLQQLGVELPNKNLRLVRVLSNGKTSIQLAAFEDAYTSFKKIFPEACNDRVVQYLTIETIRHNQMSVDDVFFWIKQSHVHFILTHAHQGLDISFEYAAWNVIHLEEVMQTIRYHPGFPSGIQLTCPIFLQDKFRYLAAMDGDVLPSLKVSLVQDDDKYILMKLELARYCIVTTSFIY